MVLLWNLSWQSRLSSDIQTTRHSPHQQTAKKLNTSNSCHYIVFEMRSIDKWRTVHKATVNVHVSSCSQRFGRISWGDGGPRSPCRPSGRRWEPRYGPTTASCPTPAVRGSSRPRPGSSTGRHVPGPSHTQMAAQWSCWWLSASAAGHQCAWRDATGTSLPL